MTEIATGLGDDHVSIDGATFSQSVAIGSGAGDDEVSVLRSTMSADLSIYTTTGDDSIQIAGSTIGGNLKAFVGDGDDVVNLAGGSVAGDVTVSGWYGNDGSLIENETIDGNVTLRARGGDAGNDFGNLPTDDNDLWDVDGNGTVTPLTDGLLNIRYLAGFSGPVLVEGALGENATRTDPDLIESYRNFLWFDTEGNFPAGQSLPLTVFTATFLTSASFDGANVSFTSTPLSGFDFTTTPAQINLSASPLSGNVDGDTDFDANDSFLMHLVNLSGTDAQVDQSKGSSPLTAAEIRLAISQLAAAGDVDGDGDFDANDSFLIHLVKLSGTDAQVDQSKGASPLDAAQIRARINALTPTTTASVSAESSEVLQAVRAGDPERTEVVAAETIDVIETLDLKRK
ncbi:MAG: hypothetical protein GY903_28610 [Fuerstiella sp.]|nr:hypothetical protein [Fuerstiella sp.]MCP4858457.1 hypothetical protein [Fuerstiella sp.]